MKLKSLMATVRAVRHYRQLCRLARRSPDQLRAHQWTQLQKVVLFAATKIPFYRSRLSSSVFLSGGLRSMEDFQRIPFTTKEDIRAYPINEFLPDNFGGDYELAQTTGSSGLPLAFYRDSQSNAWNTACLFYALRAVGVRWYDRFCHIVSPRATTSSRRGFLASLGWRRYHAIPLRNSPADILLQIARIRPRVIYTFPSVFLRLAAHLQENGSRVPVGVLVAHGEMLPMAWRTIIEAAFGRPLYHMYGSTEFPRLGFECERKRGFHLIPDAGYVEVVDADGKCVPPGQEGDLVITHLNNQCMPLLRYRLGDRGILSADECPCGHPYPLLEAVTGRSDDFLILPSGAKLSARAINQMEIHGVREYRIIQKSPKLFHVMVVPSKDYGPATVEAIQKQILMGCGGESVDVEVTSVDQLPLAVTGKHRAVIREF